MPAVEQRQLVDRQRDAVIRVDLHPPRVGRAVEPGPRFGIGVDVGGEGVDDVRAAVERDQYADASVSVASLSPGLSAMNSGSSVMLTGLFAMTLPHWSLPSWL